MNVLILSCGTRNKIVQYFRRELAGRGMVLATDCSKLAPALYEADRYFIVPRMTDSGYLDVILSICKEYNVKIVFSLIDPELSFLAKHKQEFLNIGTTPIVSDYSVVELCFDKWAMHQFLVQHGFRTAKSYIDKTDFYNDESAGLINFPVFIKPVRGSASANIKKVTSSEELEVALAGSQDMLIQEFIDGQEYGADVYVDMISGKVTAIFLKEKLHMRAGETDKSRSAKDDKMFGLIQDFVDKSGLKGVIDIDLFKKDDNYYISEVNPRFGGGYPHGYECGVNIPKMILNNAQGKANLSDELGKYDEGVYMMKFNEIRIVRGE